MSFLNVQTGDIILVDMPSGAPPRTVTLTVASMTAKRFVAKGPGQTGAQWTITFLKEDGQSVGTPLFLWARRP